METMGKDADGLLGWWGQEPIPTPEDPEGDLLKKRYEARFGEPPAGSWAFAYDNVFIWAAAAKRVGNVTDYRSICKAIIDYPYKGVAARYEFSPEFGNGVKFGPDQPVFYVQIQNGKFVRLRVTSDATNYDKGIYKVVPYNEKYPWTAKTKFKTPPWLK